MAKQCIACGMPMQKDEDFAMTDPSKDYCRFCARPDGGMQSREEKEESLTAFIMRSQGVDRATARETARARMVKLPAWRERDVPR
jgi:hypothetical protein